MSKPEEINAYFTTFITEMDSLQMKGGIDVEVTSGEMQRLPIKIAALTADNPAKAVATGAAGHTAKVTIYYDLKKEKKI